MKMESELTPAELEIQLPAPTPAAALPPHEKFHWAFNMIGIGAILTLCYYAEIVLAVVLVSVLLAFILAPIVDALTFFRLPRFIAAGLAVLMMIAALGGAVYLSYNQGATLIQELPKYTKKIKDQVNVYRKRAETFEVLTPEHEKGVLDVRSTTDWTDILNRGVGSVWQAAFAASFVPFLVFFMLSWQSHVRSSTVMLFPMRSRHTAYITLGRITKMIRSFMVGNLLIGLFIGAASTLVFWILGVPFFYFAGFLSGLLSLVPYLGIVLSLAPPVFVGVGHLESSEMFYVVVTVVGLHVIAMNVMYPLFLGNRLQLNPLAVTISLLFWAWLWGGIGLLLAIPLTAAMKIIFDSVETLRPYGAWLGE